jgi:ribosomal protein L44E
MIGSALSQVTNALG